MEKKISLNSKIEELGLSKRALKGLRGALLCAVDISDVAKLNSDKLTCYQGIGTKTSEEIQNAMFWNGFKMAHSSQDVKYVRNVNWHTHPSKFLISKLDLSAQTYHSLCYNIRGLERMDCEITVEELMQYNEQEILDMKHIGEAELLEIKAALAKISVGLSQTIDQYNEKAKLFLDAIGRDTEIIQGLTWGQQMEKNLEYMKNKARKSEALMG